MAWVLIANAYGGNWDLASKEWRTTAERWRDDCHAALSPVSEDEQPICDTIIQQINAVDRKCLSNCGAHDYAILTQESGDQGGVSFGIVILDSEDRHRVQIRLTLVGDYEVNLTRLSQGGNITTEKGATCPGDELAGVLRWMCIQLRGTYETIS